MAHVLIVGAGPAGASLAYLLAQHEIEVTLIERQDDFSREFRGELLMPSGLEAIEEMGLRGALEAVPGHTLQSGAVYLSGRSIFAAEVDPDFFDGRPPRVISQPDFLEMFVREAAQSPRFRFERGASVKDLLEERGRVVGVRVRRKDGESEIRADLVVGADGRASAVRKHAGLRVDRADPPMDVVWCKLPCPDDWQGGEFLLDRGHLSIAYRSWDGRLQLAWVILKGTFGELKSRGIEDWVEEMADHVSPRLAAHLRSEIASVDKPFLLSTASDCLEEWSAPGVLAIGDAAHTMSPVGGQGINVALRDAIVAANHLVPVLTESKLDERALCDAMSEIERERMKEIAPIQKMQAFPPRVVLSRAWWGEPLRQFLGVLVNWPLIQFIAVKRLGIFPFGVTRVRLKV